MAKVLRLHNGNDNIVDWQNSNVIGSDPIKDILDPEDGNAKKEITSIPSPFARIDLVKTAFSEIVNNKRHDLDGNTIYHKMVSDSLDVGELFFNIQRFSDKFQILYWDKTKHLEELLSSDIEAHRAIGKTIEMYMQQDAAAYNFDKLDRLYLLNYVGPDRPAQMNIVGATSPCTLFFSSANNLEYVSKHISFGQYKCFDDNFCPLYKRDFEFIKYLWAFKSNYSNFSVDFSCINEYLNLTYSRLSLDKKNILDTIDANSINDYEVINIQDINNNVEILKHSFHQRPVRTLIKSDFEIDSSIYPGKKPLVLPIESGNSYTSLFYTQDLWAKNDKAPAYDTTNWQNRKLPIDGSDYPYLTISDFLEDTIVKVPYRLNRDFFFDGHIESTVGSYLLPLKSTFFDFFTTKDLMGEVTDGKRMFEFRENAGGVTATIRIPIIGKNNIKYIEYQRTYYTNNLPDLLVNKGGLINKRFGMGLFPGIEFKDIEKPHYRIALFDKGQKNIRLAFHRATENVPEKDRVVRREKDINNDLCSIETYVVNERFDRISVNIDSINALVIPKYRKTSGSAQFTFAIDFGTSNTHMEYSKDGQPSKAFDITNEEKQMLRLHTDYLDSLDIDYGFIENNVPDNIGEKELYKFPLRTAFAEYTMIDYAKATYTLASGNIAFRYEKAATPSHNTVKTDLKWSTQKKDQVKLFLANIFLLMRNKVLLNGGNLSTTKIIWFYPASMTEAHYNNFKKIWNEMYLEYIGDNTDNVVAMSESVAPYSFYIKKRGAKSNVVTIDIGGGTTDVYVVENRVPKMLSSFRFAANSIFGDGYSWDATNNGFVKLFKGDFIDSLSRNGLSELIKALESIDNTKVSSDITAFFFALSQNRQVKDKNIPSLDFLDKLESNDQLKYVFILFYTAILYYVALLMKAKGLALPLTIAFSGNGSKTLSVLSSDKTTLAKYAKLVFEKVYGERYDHTNDLEVIYEENPKEATCKGGILSPVKQDFDNIDSLKCSLLGIDKSVLVQRQPMSTIDDALLNKIVHEIQDFIDFTFELNEENDNLFAKKFNADSRLAGKIKDLCYKNLLEYIKHGIDNRKEELASWGADEKIEETLFFLPLVGMLNNIAREIANN